MKWLFLTAILLAFASSSAAEEQNVSEYSILFVWPSADEEALEDRRLDFTIDRALAAEYEASSSEKQAKVANGQAERRLSLLNSVGRKPKPIVVDDGTRMIAAPQNATPGALIGYIHYPSGAQMTGVFGQHPSLGLYVASPESPLIEFWGEVSLPETSTPMPNTGLFKFKNGDTFLGQMNEMETFGVYCSPDCEKKFIGSVDFSSGVWTPVSGYMLTKNGKLLATVY